jgi:hypothetical protein
MARLHPRYVEAFTPAVAGALGVGLAALGTRGRREWLRVGATVAALAAVVLYARYLGRSQPEAVRIAAFAALLAALARVLLASPGYGPRARRAFTVAVPTLAAVACLALPAAISIALVRTHASDAGRLAVIPPAQATKLKAFLNTQPPATRYALAVYDPSRAATLIVDGLRPILPLSSWEGRPLVGLRELRTRVAAGQVRYVLTDSASCSTAAAKRRAGCLPAVRWARRHGRDVSAAAGVERPFHVYDLRGR